MSRRFGRQQKRSMRRQIEALEAQTQRLERDLRLSRTLAARNSQIVEDTARVLGRHFITLDPVVIELKRLHDLGDWFKCVVETHEPMLDASDKAGQFVSAALVDIQHLPVMKARAFLDDMRSATHFRFKFKGREVGYAVSQRTIAYQPGFKELVRRQIMEAAGRLFMDVEMPDQQLRNAQEIK
ncbi:MAG: hypothetical protein Q8L60_10875 [Gammaproteobacteria bacterium]|nr:hypothetical protein [Gammaproteobacteria bacterium]MDP2346850.1 hypothetical protein [Gammaproteobacteria bacterium]